MKFYRYILLFAMTGTVCSCSDFLDKSPELNLTDGDIYGSQSRMEGAVKGVYSQMKEGSFIGSKAYVCIENIGDDMINVSGNGIEALYSYEMSVGMDTQDNYETWNSAYTVINSANTALENLESHKDVAGDKYNQYMAELKFCRALSYYYLNMLYAQPYLINPNASSVPLRLKAENTLENNDLACSSVSEVFQQILDDTEGYAALPQGGGSYEKITRATQAAALMLRMRVYMAMGKWNEAINAGTSIKGYSLCSGVKEPFTSSSGCPESIFSFPMDTNNHGGGMQTAVPYFYYSGNSLVIDAFSGIHSPLYAAYNMEKDHRISDLTSTVNGQCVLTKFTDGQTYLDWVPVFRYAETLLNLAECYYMSHEESKAVAALKQVRRRSVSESDDMLDIESLSGDDLKSAIINERRAEFIGEAIRALDIHRRGETFVKRKGTSSEFAVGPDMNGYVWPIPTVERANNHLVQ